MGVEGLGSRTSHSGLPRRRRDYRGLRLTVSQGFFGGSTGFHRIPVGSFGFYRVRYRVRRRRTPNGFYLSSRGMYEVLQAF